MVLDNHPNKEIYEKAQTALQGAGFEVELGAKTKGMITTFVKKNGGVCAQLIIMEAAGGTFAFRGKTIAKGMADASARQFAQKLSAVQDETLREQLKAGGESAFLYWPADSLIYAMIGGNPADINETAAAWLQVVDVLKPIIG